MSNELAQFGINDLSAMADAMASVAAEPTGNGFDGKDLLKLTQDGEWLFGMDDELAPKRVVVNPGSFKRGWVSWHNSAIAGEVMVAVGQPVPHPDTLPTSPVPYSEQFSFECADPADPTVQLVYKTSSMGGCKAIKGLVGQIGAQLKANSALPVPEIELDFSSYQNKKYGNKTIYTPVLRVARWTAIDGEAPAAVEAPAEPAPERKTRRRPAA